MEDEEGREAGGRKKNGRESKGKDGEKKGYKQGKKGEGWQRSERIEGYMVRIGVGRQWKKEM